VIWAEQKKPGQMPVFRPGPGAVWLAAVPAGIAAHLPRPASCGLCRSVAQKQVIQFMGGCPSWRAQVKGLARLARQRLRRA